MMEDENWTADSTGYSHSNLPCRRNLWMQPCTLRNLNNRNNGNRRENQKDTRL